jgi:hypothetical protein
LNKASLIWDGKSGYIDKQRREDLMKKKATSDIARAKESIARRMNSKAAKNESIHVVSHKSKWAVIVEGSQKAYRICPTKEGAISSAKHLVKNGIKKEIVIHKKDGSVERQVKSTSISDDKAVASP